MTTRETIQRYFDAIHAGGWESFIADDFVFVNSNLDRAAHGRAAYVEGAGRFFRATTKVEVKKLIVDGNDASVIARYQVRSPRGTTSLCDVAEVLSVRDGKIASNAIFFDTAAFREFMAAG